jgi:hypothetical protein
VPGALGIDYVTVYGIEVAREDIEALLPAPTKEPTKRQSLRQEMLQAIRRRLYPRGVPKSTSTATVMKQIELAWPAECQARGVEPSDCLPPKWDMVDRALGRSSH